jgi:hypothetical protein
MAELLTELRRRSLEAMEVYVKAQRAYLEAAHPSQRKPAAELKRCAESILFAIVAYKVALRAHLEGLRVSEPSAHLNKEVEQTETMLFIADKEQITLAYLIDHHAKMIR